MASVASDLANRVARAAAPYNPDQVRVRGTRTAQTLLDAVLVKAHRVAGMPTGNRKREHGAALDEQIDSMLRRVSRAAAHMLQRYELACTDPEAYDSDTTAIIPMGVCDKVS